LQLHDQQISSSTNLFGAGSGLDSFHHYRGVSGLCPTVCLQGLLNTAVKSTILTAISKLICPTHQLSSGWYLLQVTAPVALPPPSSPQVSHTGRSATIPCQARVPANPRTGADATAPSSWAGQGMAMYGISVCISICTVYNFYMGATVDPGYLPRCRAARGREGRRGTRSG
jgi:hypothetical protein